MAQRLPFEHDVDDDRGRPLVAGGEVRVKSADLDRLASGAPAQRVDRMAAGREQVAASARSGPHPVPAADTSRSPARGTACARSGARQAGLSSASSGQTAAAGCSAARRTRSSGRRRSAPHRGCRRALLRPGRSASRAGCACRHGRRRLPRRHADDWAWRCRRCRRRAPPADPRIGW